MTENLQYLEKQYLGVNKISISIRLSLAIFCFFCYYWKGPESDKSDIYFLMGVIILITSCILIFILHFETKVINNSIILDGLWTARKVKIDINSLKSVEIVSYSRFFLNRSVYNLHFKGSIRFFTRGKDAVKLIDKDGQVYLIGSQKVEELERTIKNKLNKD